MSISHRTTWNKVRFFQNGVVFSVSVVRRRRVNPKNELIETHVSRGKRFWHPPHVVLSFFV